MKNKGYSLIELIASVAIISIMVGSAFYGLGFMDAANAKKCANSIYSGIASAKSQTMSQAKPVHMYLYRANDCFYIKYSEESDVSSIVMDGSDAKEIKVRNVRVTFEDGTTLGNNTIKKISFNRKNGSIKEGPEKIIVSGSGSFTITLVHKTGKYFME